MGWQMELTKYQLHKQHKISQYLENEATEWVLNSITEHFDVETVEQLSIQDIEEVVEEYEKCEDQYIAMALRNSISVWENENDQFIL